MKFLNFQIGLLVTVLCMNYLVLGDMAYTCDVIIAGGSTAALGAALSAARADANLVVCLTEPSDWLGGQLTSSAVSAIDFGTLNRNWWFQSTTFQAMINSLGSNHGACWVSTVCYLPKDILVWINDNVARLPNLKVFYNTVVKSVTTDNDTVSSVYAIQRSSKDGIDQWGRLLSDTIRDWYSPADSAMFTKSVITLQRSNGGTPVIIDASEFGDVLALGKTGYRQGVEYPTENSSATNERCGQRFTIPFYMNYNHVRLNDTTPLQSHGVYSMGTSPWGNIWSYRRSKSMPGLVFHQAHIGEIANQNWGTGNDFLDSYILLSESETTGQLSNWMGGIDVSVLLLGEARAYGWYHFYKNQSGSIKEYLGLDTLHSAGTQTGLAKLPYIRDTRRSVGLDGFVLKKSDMDTPVCSSPNISQVSPNVNPHALNCKQYATRFPDSVAIGNYLADIHGVANCAWPSYINNYKTLPFHVPFRALTNQRYSNLLVAGKTMSQTFMANAATRTHPTEFATGEAAGMAASLMVNNGYSSRDMLANIDSLQKELRKFMPLYWDEPRVGQLTVIG
ncbi:hypothetical protein DPMN_034587 [Dreissena polymorpha]|uniref:FAD-dependent oxidoreductase n=1 Tax=Dreissena polymorpha TaxID=45954 RepID=A0A9D4M5S1_DREPO|nr:hypothetical protein DPMN_034587 [Dreissena polymorpha]